MKEFLLLLVSKIIDHPSELKIEETQMDQNIFQYKIFAHEEDIGKIIGREGKIIQAIRNIARILAVKEEKQIRIEIA